MNNVLESFERNSIRSRLVQKNIMLLFINKVLAAFISLQLIPSTINYVNPEQYGVWLTLSSIVGWMVYFDMGLTHGFRNGFATAKAKKNYKLAKEYVSTSFAILAIIFFGVMILLLAVSNWLNWSDILMVDQSMNETLHEVFVVLIIFFSLQMVFNLFITLLLADQKSGLSAIIVTFGQFLSLITVFILTSTTDGNLVYLAFALLGIPTISLIIISLSFFKTKLRKYNPSLEYINWQLSKEIIGLGGKFFVIQLSMLFVFQFANFIILRVLGAETVTTYTIVYRYFSIIYVVMGTIFAPFWSAFTDAHAKGDFLWMKRVYAKLSKIWFVTFLLFLGLFLISSYVYKHWLAKNITIEESLSLAMGLNMIILSRANLYMVCLNGIGKVFIQMIIYIFFAVLSIPLMFYFTNVLGLYGVLFVTSLVYICQAIFGHIQLNMIFRGTENGIWSK